MSPLLPRNLLLLILTGAAILTFICFSWKNSKPLITGLRSKSSPAPLQSNASILSDFNIFVVSLPRRKDRRDELETLRDALGLRWNYVDAVDSTDGRVDKVTKQVRNLREDVLPERKESMNDTADFSFQWPGDIDARSSDPSSDLWLSPSSYEALTGTSFDSDQPLTTATENFTILPYTSDLPETKILTPSRIACWLSHLSVIRRVANDTAPAVILEDDVDMEKDIHYILRSVWTLLPEDWDIVFLGHCWSNESYYPAIEPVHAAIPGSFHPHPRPNRPLSSSQMHVRLHPSRQPLCTHAYALSPRGARRLLLHLRYPPFAYSRAIDHAIAWLIAEKRLRSYSIVPSVVVQRKIGSSDVMEGKGSNWRDGLIDGVFGTRTGTSAT